MSMGEIGRWPLESTQSNILFDLFHSAFEN